MNLLSKWSRRSVLAAVVSMAIGLPLAAHAQEAKKEEEPFWAKGRPNTDTAMKMAPVPAFPIPTPADKLPTVDSAPPTVRAPPTLA